MSVCENECVCDMGVCDMSVCDMDVCDMDVCVCITRVPAHTSHVLMVSGADKSG